MDTMTYKDFEGTAELDMARGVCRGKLLFIADLVTYQAETPAKLREAFEEAVDDYLETCRTLEREPQKPFRGQFNVRVSPALHRGAALRAKQDDVTLNEIVGRALDCFLHGPQLVLETRAVEVAVGNQEQKIVAIASVANNQTHWKDGNVIH